IWISPPSLVRPTRLGNALIIAAVAVFLLKEFGPSQIFGSVSWRTTLAESYGVTFPWTHNPEPSRALDGLLAGIAAIVWFLWARTLALDRSRRTVMIWGMLVSAAIVSIVSFATCGMDPQAIYGMRYTPGWVGFGPFPNRNHTACFLAMGVALGAGCAGWAGVRAHYKFLGSALALSLIAFAGLLATQSRGGIVVLVAGLGIFMLLVVFRFPGVRTFAIAAGAALVMAALGLAFGAQAIARFSSKEGGEVSTMMRVHIWQDAVRVWKDAPIFGHGIGTFTQIFPMYQEVATGESIVLHPESSWLQWLAELGALPVLFGAIALVVYVLPRIRLIYSADRSIFMRAGPLAAAAMLIVHAVFDVPAHRWATAGFGLATLAIACAPTGLAGLIPAPRKAALVPVGIAAFWTLPFLVTWPAWSPLSLTRLLAREQTTPFVSVTELERSLAYFPLNPTLHYSIGMHQIDDPLGRRAAEWQQHFRIATRLMPGSWELAAMEARACMRVSPGISLHYWQVAVERAGHRADEVLGIAMQETVRVRGAAAAWEQYARVHPEFLLTYARNVPEAASREAVALWWTERASAAKDLSDAEVATFYSLVAERGTREQFEQFCRRHTDLRARDHVMWVNTLHKWEADAAAWEIIAAEWPEPPLRPASLRADPALLAGRWESTPDDVVNAREYAEHLERTGKIDQAHEMILNVAKRSEAAEWFLRKAARVHAARGNAPEAVELFLRQKHKLRDSQ
ncbi:MAG: O-antigen ligase family protein, partial [Chthoniobacteraceae bacterium]